MKSDMYYHTILPFSQFESFYSDHRMEMLDIFEHYLYANSNNSYISTLQMQEITELDDFLMTSLDIRPEFSEMIKMLPRDIQNTIYRTKLSDIISDPMIIDIVNLLDGDADKLEYLAQACYYSGQDFIDITGI